VLFGDRIYSNPVGVAHVLRAGGDVLVRLNPHTLPLYGSDGTRLNVLGAVSRLKVGQHLDLPAAMKSAAGETFAGRLVALRRSAAATRREQRRLQRKASKQQRTISSQRLRLARYLLLWTTLPAAHAAADIGEFYRWRWQIDPGTGASAQEGSRHGARLASRQAPDEPPGRAHDSSRKHIFPLRLLSSAAAGGGKWNSPTTN
jgi:hypothetical protein